MIDAKDVIVGQYIWTQYDGDYSSWNSPGVITAIEYDAKSFSIMTYDDYKVTDNWTTASPTIRKSDAFEVKKFLIKRIAKAEIKKIEAQQVLDTTSTEIDRLKDTMAHLF